MSSAFSFSPFFSSLTFTNSGGHPTNLVKLLEMLRFSSLCLLIHFLATSIITEGMLSLPLTSHYWETAMKAIMYSRQMKGRGARCLQSCVLEFQSALLPASNHVFACWATKQRHNYTLTVQCLLNMFPCLDNSWRFTFRGSVCWIVVDTAVASIKSVLSDSISLHSPRSPSYL